MENHNNLLIMKVIDDVANVIDFDA